MLIGTLKNRVSLQRLVEVRDTATGALSKTWPEVAQVWADIRYQNGAETLRSDTAISAARASIRIRRRDDVTAKWRVVYRTTVFNILAVLPDEQSRDHLDLACETGATDA